MYDIKYPIDLTNGSKIEVISTSLLPDFVKFGNYLFLKEDVVDLTTKFAVYEDDTLVKHLVSMKPDIHNPEALSDLLTAFKDRTDIIFDEDGSHFRFKVNVYKNFPSLKSFKLDGVDIKYAPRKMMIGEYEIGNREFVNFTHHLYLTTPNEQTEEMIVAIADSINPFFKGY